MSRSKRQKRRSYTPADWENLPDEEILQFRVRDLGLQIHNSPVAEFIQKLHGELDSHGIRFHPPCYLADEWFCPDGIPIIGIPFCLAHPRLKRVEEKMMYEVEGGTAESCMKLLRHECGHAVNYAYGLYKRTRWRELFGHFSTRYSSSYGFQPYSRRYVTHLEGSYAQAHPDEDFAETFAVWLTPNSGWEEKYVDWPVVKKLRYVNHLMRAIGDRPPAAVARQTPWSAARMTSTLAAHYERKRKYLGEDFSGYYDASLKRLFSLKQASDPARKASKLLRRYRRQIMNGVSAWTGQRKYDIHQLVNKLVKRCDSLDLYANAPDTEMAVDVTAFVTAVANNVLRPGTRGKRE